MRIKGNRKEVFLAGVAAAVVGTALLGAGTRQDPLEAAANALLSPSEAFVPLPPEIIVPGGTVSVHPSPNGTAVLVERIVTPPVKSLLPETGPKRAEVSVVFWSASSRRVTTLWRDNIEMPGKLPARLDISYLPKSPLALIQYAPIDSEGSELATLPMRLMAADTERGTLRTVATLTLQDQIIIAANRPLAAIARNDYKTVQLLRPDGSLGKIITLSEPGIRVYNWTADGATLIGLRPPAAPEATDAEKKKSRWVLINSQTGVVTSAEKRPPFAKDDAPTLSSPLTIRAGTGALTEADTIAKIAPLWLEGAKPDVTGRILLAPDGENPLMLSNAALYQRHGALFAVPILRMDRVAFAKLQREALRRKTLTNAKMIGLAMLMYCQDYDENFAPAGTGEEIADKIDPYLKNRDAFNDLTTGKMGFTPLYKITALSGYDTPSTQLLGSLSGPGGRVLIYVDGHVKWEEGQ